MPQTETHTLDTLAKQISGLQVFQSAVGTLMPYAQNSRTHSPEQLKQIVQSFEEFGVLAPVLVDDQQMILAGHARVQAAKNMGLATVPTVTIHGLTPTQKRAYVIADNRIALNSGWDAELLHMELKAIAAMNFDLPVLGFSTMELNMVFSPPVPPPPVPEVPTSHLLTCPKCHSQFAKA